MKNKLERIAGKSNPEESLIKKYKSDLKKWKVKAFLGDEEDEIILFHKDFGSSDYPSEMGFIDNILKDAKSNGIIVEFESDRFEVRGLTKIA